MAKKIVSFSLDEEVIHKIEQMVRGDIEIQSKSHLMTVLVLNGHRAYVRRKKQIEVQNEN